ncbi:hypothetical protein [Rhizomonospora bruguierae]|uniref:hypothetical protein n=1 Tax=Rhizomonospora bruguierae TaxID=1581705 RepID=UPI001BCDD4C7|nr:hypothetical protein [Micromonospora sp. NBRC 107566]
MTEEGRPRTVPGWVAPVFATLAAGTVGWTGYLAATLPRHVLTGHYRLAWVGFDCGLVALLLATAVLAWHGHRRTELAAAATGTMLVVDGWFDIATTPRDGLPGALATAVLVELPLAVLCLWLALHVDRVVERRLRYLARRADRAQDGTRSRPAAD